MAQMTTLPMGKLWGMQRMDHKSALQLIHCQITFGPLPSMLKRVHSSLPGGKPDDYIIDPGQTRPRWWLRQEAVGPEPSGKGRDGKQPYDNDWWNNSEPAATLGAGGEYHTPSD